MATIVEQAANGQRKAMEQLYAQNKQKVFYLAEKLLLNEEQATAATAWVFKNIWGSLASSKIESEDDFTNLAVRRTVDFCKRTVSKKNEKAFRLPNGRNFSVMGPAKTNAPVTNDDFVLRELPDLQRFILVLHTVGNMPDEQTAKVFKFDLKSIQMALTAEEINVERIIQAGQMNRTYYEIVTALIKNETNAEVPASVDEQVAAAIDSIAKPIEKKQRKKLTMIASIAVAVCLVLIIGIVMTSQSKDSTTTGDEDLTLTASDTDSESDLNTDTDVDQNTDNDSISSDLDAELTYYADITIEDYGTITVQLDQEAAPITVANFVDLAESGFYDGLTFHRIIDGFMMQGGDPNGDGTGGSENTITGEFTNNGYENDLSHTRGAISMARSSDNDSASSQFFIVHEDSTYLDGDYAVFGYVTDGMDIVDAICESAEPIDNNGTISAEDQPIITSITIWTE